jgi:hypothetical protein
MSNIEQDIYDIKMCTNRSQLYEILNKYSPNGAEVVIEKIRNTDYKSIKDPLAINFKDAIENKLHAFSQLGQFKSISKKKSTKPLKKSTKPLKKSTKPLKKSTKPLKKSMK